ncbi:MAG: YbjN domain-containing protein [Pseudomonadota bacterium]
MKASLALFALLLSLASPALFADDLIDATDPDAVLNVARGFGSARLSEDGIGDPLISGRIKGEKYKLFFYMCEDNKNCKDVQFWSGWTGTDVTLQDVNRWNNEKRFGKAYIDDEGDPILTYVINLNGGVSYENLEDSFDWWQTMLSSFVTEVLESDSSSNPEVEAD